MQAVLSNNRFLVKEQVARSRAENHYDVFDAETSAMVLACREQNVPGWVRLVRFAFFRRTPFDILVRTPEGRPALRVHRGPALFRPKVTVRDGDDRVLGHIQQRFWTLRETFDVLDPVDRPLYLLVRSWTGREFSLLDGEASVARVSKKWAGLGRELFTSADTYELTVSPDVPADDPLRVLALASVIAIDMLLFE